MFHFDDAVGQVLRPDPVDPARRPQVSDPTLVLGRWLDSPQGREVARAVFVGLTTAIFTPAIGVVFPAFMVPTVQKMAESLFQGLLQAESSEALAGAILSAAILQSGRALSRLVSADSLRSVGVDVPPDVAALGGGKLQGLAAQYIAERFTGDLALLASPRYDAARDVAARARSELVRSLGKSDLDLELRKLGMSPEAFADKLTAANVAAVPLTAFPMASPVAREDVAAMALNAQLGTYVYDIDWFDPATGRFRPARELRPILEELERRDGPPQAIAALRSRVDSAPLSELIRRAESKRFIDPLTDVARRHGMIPAEYRRFVRWRSAYIDRYRPGLIAQQKLIERWRAFHLWMLLGGLPLDAFDADPTAAIAAYERSQAPAPPPPGTPAQPFDAIFAPGGPLDPAKEPTPSGSVLAQLVRAVVLTSPAWATILLLRRR